MITIKAFFSDSSHTNRGQGEDEGQLSKRANDVRKQNKIVAAHATHNETIY